MIVIPSFANTALAIFILASLPAEAQLRPDYRRALTDLRVARHLLDAPGDFRAVEDQRRAIGRINAAIRDIEQGGMRYRRNLAWREPGDVARLRTDRFRQARLAVVSAIRDIDRWETNRNAGGWRARAAKDLNDSLHFIDLAIADREGSRRVPR